MSDTAVKLEAPRRLLVIIVARIGDTLLATPAIRALAARYPTARITVLAHPQRMALLRHLPFIDELAPITKQRALWRGHLTGLFGKPFDAAVVFGNDRPLQEYAKRVSRLVVIEVSEDPMPGGDWLSVSSPSESEHAVLHRLRWVAALDASPAGRNLAYVATTEERNEAKAVLSGLSVVEDVPVRWLGIQLQSFPTKAYRDWPADHFRSLLERLLPAVPDLRVVVFGDGASVSAAQALATAFPGKVFSLAGRLTLRQTAAVMSHLCAYLGVDTGPTHLAGALGIPVVALYHCKHPGRYLAPLDHPELTMIEHPATEGECGPQQSMAEISVDQVFDAVVARLSFKKNTESIS